MAKKNRKTETPALELPPIEEQLANLTILEGAAEELIASLSPEAIADIEALTQQTGQEEAPAPASEPDQAPAEEEDPDQAETMTFAEVVASVPDEERTAATTYVAKGFDDRAEFERQSNPDNETIHKSLNKSRAKLALPTAAAVLIAAEVPLAFMNRSISSGTCYNVYAIDKVADLVKALGGGELNNAINIAVCRSLFRFRAAGETFTGEMAKAAASDKIRVTATLQKILVRHTVSATTAPTQASSTMQALQTLGIVVNRGSQKAPAYHLTDTPQTKRLEEVVQKLAA